MSTKKNLFAFLLLALLMQACLQATPPEAQVKAEATATKQRVETSAPPATQTSLPPTSMPTLIIPTATNTTESLPEVIVAAATGNLFIRRGPDMAYNPIGTLYKGTSAKALMRDVLSNWVQIAVPNSDKTGWVSVMTEYTQVEGNIGLLPEFKITDWPQPSYVRNCTNHQLILYPGAIYVEGKPFAPQNEVWVYPGYYRVFDLDMPDPVELDEIITSEGTTIDIRYDGAGERRKCE